MLKIIYIDRPLKNRETYEILRLIRQKTTKAGIIKFKKKYWAYTLKNRDITLEELEPKQLTEVN